MPQRQNFLLGRGESLVEPIVVPGRPMEKEAPYPFADARNRVTKMLTAAVKSIDALPSLACPGDQAVASLKLHPEYIAKSYFPSKLLDAVGLRAVGSRGTTLIPERRSKARKSEEKPTTELFIAGPRAAFRSWMTGLPRWQPTARGAEDLTSVEHLDAIKAQTKIRSVVSKAMSVMSHTEYPSHHTLDPDEQEAPE